mgnify:CR=1 FL=1
MGPKVEQPLEKKGGGVSPAPKKFKPASTAATPTKEKAAPLKKGDEDENGDAEKEAEKQVSDADEEDEPQEDEEL